MLFILIYLFSIYYSVTHKSIVYWSIFQFLLILIIGLYFIFGVDVVYKVNIGMASDTRLYYQGYTSSWDNIADNLFYEYPFLLRILTFPWVSSLFATWGQGTLLFLLLDIIVKNKQNLLLFVFLHAFLYTCTNLFKDNLIILIGLVGYILLERCNKVFCQCIVVFILIMAMSWVRPYLKFILPFSFFPIFLHIESYKVKNVILFCTLALAVVILYGQREFILGVMNSFSEDAALSEGRSSVPVAIIKIFLGPTPMHYILAQQYFEQPFLPAHTCIFGIIHYIFYFNFCFFIVFVFSNYKAVLNIYKASVSRLFLLLIAIAQLFVYVLIYGSADIRQRGVILTFICLYCIVGRESVFRRRFSRSQFLIFVTMFCLVNILTAIG